MNKKGLIAITLMLAVFLSACTDSTEPNRIPNVSAEENSIQGEIVADEVNQEMPTQENEQEEEMIVEETTQTGITNNILSQHSADSDCWIGFEGKVYDITDWLPRHPGSAAAISPYCGTNTEFENAFAGFHGTSKVKKLLAEGIFIGELN